MWTANFVEYWICCLAAWELGAAVMPVNCLIHTDKLATQLLETAAGYLVCDELNLDDALALKSKVSSIKHIILMDQVNFIFFFIVAYLNSVIKKSLMISL